jgi:MFS transporter, FHS family, glucose/mannose:H+ symporter
VTRWSGGRAFQDGTRGPRHSRASLRLIVGFVVTGMVTTMLGPVLPWLSERWVLSDPAAGALFTLQFACGLTGGTISGLLVNRVGDTRTLAAGYALMSVGTFTLSIAGYLPGVIGICAAGLGMGFVIPTTNLLVAKLQPDRAAAALSAVNLAWGAGAAVWPIVVATAARAAGSSWAFAGLAVLNVAMAAVMLGVPALASSASERRVDSRRDPIVLVAVFGASLFLYTGIETAFGGWLPEHARRSIANAPPIQWTLAATAFWSGITGGRALFSFRLPVRLESGAAIAGLLLVSCSLLLLLRANSVMAVTASAALGGLGLAPVFPVTVAAMSRRVRGTIAGPLIALGSLGGATVPWIVGAVSGRTGSLTSGLATLLAITAILISLHVVRLSVLQNRADRAVE